MGESCWRAITALVISSLVVLSFTIPGTAAAADPTVDVVKRRGELVCGVNGSLPGFSLLNAVKEWEGLDVDLCRGVAAAVLGKVDRVKFVALTPQQRFQQLASGGIDVLAANSTITLQRSAGLAWNSPRPPITTARLSSCRRSSALPGRRHWQAATSAPCAAPRTRTI